MLLEPRQLPSLVEPDETLLPSLLAPSSLPQPNVASFPGFYHCDPFSLLSPQVVFLSFALSPRCQKRQMQGVGNASQLVLSPETPRQRGLLDPAWPNVALAPCQLACVCVGTGTSSAALGLAVVLSLYNTTGKARIPYALTVPILLQGFSALTPPPLLRQGERT